MLTALLFSYRAAALPQSSLLPEALYVEEGEHYEPTYQDHPYWNVYPVSLSNSTTADRN